MHDERVAPEAAQKKPAVGPPAVSFIDAATIEDRKCRSARRFAAAGHADLFLQAIEPDGADHHLLADHVTRRAVHAHLLGELEVFLDGGAHFRACKVLFQSGYVEAGIFRRGHGVSLVGPAAAWRLLNSAIASSSTSGWEIR